MWVVGCVRLGTRASGLLGGGSELGALGLIHAPSCLHKVHCQCTKSTVSHCALAELCTLALALLALLALLAPGTPGTPGTSRCRWHCLAPGAGAWCPPRSWGLGLKLGARARLSTRPVNSQITYIGLCDVHYSLYVKCAVSCLFFIMRNFFLIYL
jgi:hypothetical protein